MHFFSVKLIIFLSLIEGNIIFSSCQEKYNKIFKILSTPQTGSYLVVTLGWWLADRGALGIRAV